MAQESTNLKTYQPNKQTTGGYRNYALSLESQLPWWSPLSSQFSFWGSPACARKAECTQTGFSSLIYIFLANFFLQTPLWLCFLSWLFCCCCCCCHLGFFVCLLAFFFFCSNSSSINFSILVAKFPCFNGRFSLSCLWPGYAVLLNDQSFIHETPAKWILLSPFLLQFRPPPYHLLLFSSGTFHQGHLFFSQVLFEITKLQTLPTDIC